MGDLHFVLNESLEKFGLPRLSEKEVKKLIGNGAKRLVEDAVGSENSKIADSVYSYYSEQIANCANERTELYCGEESVLKTLKNQGVKLAVVTNKPQKAAENGCAKHLSKFGFDCIIGQTDEFPLKPNPSSTIAVMKKLRVKSDECLFVGDGETDVLTAKAAGIKCVSALWGYRTVNQLEAVGATCFAEKFTDLLKFFI